MHDDEDVLITGIGDLGDGVGESRGRKVFVPFALPGETWRLDGDGGGTLVNASADRAEPACPHFTVCGGCVAQHMPETAYLDWKRRRVVDALAAQGLSDVTVRPCFASGAGTRRRAVFSADRSGATVRFGFHERRSNAIVPVVDCAILVPAIARSLDSLRALAALLVPNKGELRLTVVASHAGLDVSVEGARAEPNVAMRVRLSDLAKDAGIARLVVDAADVVQFAAPVLMIDEVAVLPPSGAFLQATQAAEAHMIACVREAVGPAKTAADLFCGIGTFALALSRVTRMTARDSDGAAISALQTAERHVQGRKAIDAGVRDLFREPLARKELEPFQAVVLDPPRAGARAQCEMLSKSVVPVVAMVSCNPSTFARDARILVDGGFVIEWVAPIDQFVFSEHVELVAKFTRPAVRRRRT